MLEEKLLRLAKECEEELASLGYGNKIGTITYTVNYRAKKRLGQCCNKQNINVSSWLLEIGMDKRIKNTIIHEILHTFEDTKGHDSQWQYYARQVSEKSGYNITRTTSINDIYKQAGKVRPKKSKVYNWQVTCLKCGKVFYREKMAERVIQSFKSGKRTHKHCGGRNFELKRIRKVAK